MEKCHINLFLNLRNLDFWTEKLFYTKQGKWSRNAIIFLQFTDVLKLNDE